MNAEHQIGGLDMRRIWLLANASRKGATDGEVDEPRRAFSPPDPPLGDGRIRIRLAVPKDERAVFEACQDPEIQRWVPIPVPYRQVHAHDWIADAEQGWSDGSRGDLAIADASGDRFVGAVRVRPIEDHRASIGY